MSLYEPLCLFEKKCSIKGSCVKLNWENTLYIKNGNCYLEIAKCLILLIELKSAVLKNKTSFN